MNYTYQYFCRQVLHVIDGVLSPLTPKKRGDSDRYIGLKAGKLMRQENFYDLRPHSIRCINQICCVITHPSCLY